MRHLARSALSDLRPLSKLKFRFIFFDTHDIDISFETKTKIIGKLIIINGLFKKLLSDAQPSRVARSEERSSEQRLINIVDKIKKL